MALERVKKKFSFHSYVCGLGACANQADKKTMGEIINTHSYARAMELYYNIDCTKAVIKSQWNEQYPVFAAEAMVKFLHMHARYIGSGFRCDHFVKRFPHQPSRVLLVRSNAYTHILTWINRSIYIIGLNFINYYNRFDRRVNNVLIILCVCECGFDELCRHFHW